MSTTPVRKSGLGGRTHGLDAEIGARIRTAREAAGFSQERLGRKLGITFQQVQRYEKGANRVGAGTIVLIAQALGCHVLELLPRPASPDGAEEAEGVANQALVRVAGDVAELEEAHRKAAEISAGIGKRLGALRTALNHNFAFDAERRVAAPAPATNGAHAHG